MPFEKLKSKKAFRGARKSKAPRKLVIRNLKSAPTLPAEFESNTWQRLERTIDAIHASRAVGDSLEQLYGAVEALCANGLAASLYARLSNAFKAHIGGQLAASLSELAAGMPTLLAVDAAWSAHCKQTLLVRSIFLYLDRTYVLQQQQQQNQQQQQQNQQNQQQLHLPLWDLALREFRELVLLRDDARLLTAIVDALLNLIGNERGGAAIDTALVRRLLRMLGTLQLYESHFEPQLLKSTGAHYSAYATRKASEATLRNYLFDAEQLLRAETRRVDQYVDERSRAALISVVEQTMLRWGDRLDGLVKAGLPRCVAESGADDGVAHLSRLYRLLTRRGVALRQQLKEAWASYAEQQTLTLVNDESQQAALIELLLAQRERLERVERKAFGDDELLAAASSNALERAVNTRPTRVAQLAARHSDRLLRTGAKKSADELEHELERLVALFRLLRAKDVFEAFYGKFLAKRLLCMRSASDDAERSMLARLRAQCGAQYTSKLEGMFRDQALSSATADAFDADEEARAELSALAGACDLRVAVLTHGFWPQYATLECTLTAPMDATLDVFKRFYARKHSGRRLHWMHSLATCTVRANLPRGRKELDASLFQTLVLLVLNDTPQATVAQLGERTGLGVELQRTLASLSTKIRILIHNANASKANSADKEASGASKADDESTGAAASASESENEQKAVVAASDARTPFGDSVLFKVNPRFRSKLVRIKINHIQVRETASDTEKTQRGVMQSRQYQIDAAIVRIMKARKQLAHADLLTELFKQLKFPVAAADLKKRIASLLEREYIERSDHQNSTYNYLA